MNRYSGILKFKVIGNHTRLHEPRYWYSLPLSRRNFRRIRCVDGVYTFVCILSSLDESCVWNHHHDRLITQYIQSLLVLYDSLLKKLFHTHTQSRCFNGQTCLQINSDYSSYSKKLRGINIMMRDCLRWYVVLMVICVDKGYSRSSDEKFTFFCVCLGATYPSIRLQNASFSIVHWKRSPSSWYRERWISIRFIFSWCWWSH